MIYFLLKKLLSLQLKIICFNKTCTKGSNGDHEYIEILSFLLKELTLYDMFLVKRIYFHFNCNFMEYFTKLVLKIICLKGTEYLTENGSYRA